MPCSLCEGPRAGTDSDLCGTCEEYEKWRIEEAQADIVAIRS
jgi:hypothetical protein